ncbi:MAG: DinB family protein [Candidatus Eiseniibacteriota bacterium]
MNTDRPKHSSRRATPFLSAAAWCAAAASALLLLVAPVRKAAAESHTGPGAKTGVKAEMLLWISDAEEKLNDLAAAMPAEKYSWTPAPGVRSVGEVFMHVAAANYGIPTFFGVKAPEGFNFPTFEKSKTTKEDISKELRASFVHAKKGLEGMSDADMEKTATFFGMTMTGRGGYMLILSHAHEHLGQSIAYARSNGVTPPWTARQEAAIKEQQAKAAAGKK